MTEIAVDAATLRTSAGRMGEAAEVAGSVHLGWPMTDLGEAMTGSVAGMASRLVRADWIATISAWTTAVQAQQTSLVASADAYDGSDATSATGLSGLSRPGAS